MNYCALQDREEAKVATINSYDAIICPAGDKIMNISSLDIGLPEVPEQLVTHP
jgi:hypothetical protein